MYFKQIILTTALLFSTTIGGFACDQNVMNNTTCPNDYTTKWCYIDKPTKIYCSKSTTEQVSITVTVNGEEKTYTGTSEKWDDWDPDTNQAINSNYKEIQINNNEYVSEFTNDKGSTFIFHTKYTNAEKTSSIINATIIFRKNNVQSAEFHITNGTIVQPSETTVKLEWPFIIKSKDNSGKVYEFSGSLTYEGKNGSKDISLDSSLYVKNDSGTKEKVGSIKIDPTTSVFKVYDDKGNLIDSN